jgi:Fe-S oxidoreductase
VPKWDDPETLATLDLCLSCQACKSECPSNVDISKLKAEYLGQSYAHGRPVPFANRVFGNIRLINQIGSAMPELANALNQLGPMHWFVRRTLGLHKSRTLPRFDRSLFRWKRGRDSRQRVNDAAWFKRPAVILFPDCFTTYTETRIGRAAILVLEQLGYRVVLPRVGCCGRSLISTGQLEAAQRVCRSTAIDLLAVMAREQAVGVVGCEPSCVSALTDDWLDLDMDVERNALVELAKKTVLVEHFVHSNWNEHAESQASKSAKTASRSVSAVLHAHCRQKALWGTDTSSAVLRRLLGSKLTVLDSGCCGMAGAFGYLRNHYDLSMKIGEQSLFSRLRMLPADATLIAPGTSCRQQIQDGLGRNAVHPIEFVAGALKG